LNLEIRVLDLAHFSVFWFLSSSPGLPALTFQLKSGTCGSTLPRLPQLLMASLLEGDGGAGFSFLFPEAQGVPTSVWEVSRLCSLFYLLGRRFKRRVFLTCQTPAVSDGRGEVGAPRFVVLSWRSSIYVS
jgi:hypothetical protein